MKTLLFAPMLGFLMLVGLVFAFAPFFCFSILALWSICRRRPTPLAIK
jgi:hypothetical protein